jgi:hypothetical protein
MTGDVLDAFQVADRGSCAGRHHPNVQPFDDAKAAAISSTTYGTARGLPHKRMGRYLRHVDGDDDAGSYAHADEGGRVRVGRYNERFVEDLDELIDAYEPDWDCRNGSCERSVWEFCWTWVHDRDPAREAVLAAAELLDEYVAPSFN